jgi:hypothetical protein
MLDAAERIGVDRRGVEHAKQRGTRGEILLEFRGRQAGQDVVAKRVRADPVPGSGQRLELLRGHAAIAQAAQLRIDRQAFERHEAIHFAKDGKPRVVIGLDQSPQHFCGFMAAGIVAQRDRRAGDHVAAGWCRAQPEAELVDPERLAGLGDRDGHEEVGERTVLRQQRRRDLEIVAVAVVEGDEAGAGLVQLGGDREAAGDERELPLEDRSTVRLERMQAVVDHPVGQDVVIRHDDLRAAVQPVCEMNGAGEIKRCVGELLEPPLHAAPPACSAASSV